MPQLDVIVYFSQYAWVLAGVTGLYLVAVNWVLFGLQRQLGARGGLDGLKSEKKGVTGLGVGELFEL